MHCRCSCCRFRSGKVKEIIKEVLKRKLSDKQYHADSTSALTKEVADEIKARLKGLCTFSNTRNMHTQSTKSSSWGRVAEGRKERVCVCV